MWPSFSFDNDLRLLDYVHFTLISCCDFLRCMPFALLFPVGFDFLFVLLIFCGDSQLVLISSFARLISYSGSRLVSICLICHSILLKIIRVKDERHDIL